MALKYNEKKVDTVYYDNEQVKSLFYDDALVLGEVEFLEDLDNETDYDYLKFYRITSNTCGVAINKETKVTDIEIPEQIIANGTTYTVTTIDQKGFKEGFDGRHWIFAANDQIKTVTIPKTVQYIGFQAFLQCRQLTTVTFKTDEHTGKSNLIWLGSQAFRGCVRLTEINLQDTQISSVHYQTFANCEALTRIILPDTVTTIEDGAFRWCESLNFIKLSANTEKIGPRAFSWCRALSEIFIPKNVTEIGFNAFNACGALVKTKIFCQFDETQGNNCGWWWQQDNNEILWNCYNMFQLAQLEDGTYEITEAVQALLPANLFIPSNYKDENTGTEYFISRIGDEAFFNCDGLISVEISDNITSIGRSAFENCNNLSSVILGQNITKFGSYVFCNCTSLKSIEIPSRAEYISHYMFKGCTSLSEVKISNTTNADGTILGASQIGESAFENCTNLAQIVIPRSVTTIAREAFYGCINTHIYCQFSSPQDGWSEDWNVISSNLFGGNKKYANVTYTLEGCDATADNCFTFKTWKDGTASITGLSTVGESLSEIVIPSTIIDKEKTYEVKSISDRAFRYCKTFSKITIPDSVTSIGNEAFCGCSSLTNVVIGDKVNDIGPRAFHDCSSLVSVTIPDSVTSIGGSAFSYCSRLSNIVIGNSVTSISGHAFSGCSNLTSVVIPDSVTSISDHAFYNCTNLTRVDMGDNITYIGPHTFSNCSALKTVNLSDTLTSITSQLFAFCSQLESIAIPDSVEVIQQMAFQDCKNLKEVIFTSNSNLKTIEQHAFSGCSSLTKEGISTIPKGVTILSGAFKGCDSLASSDFYSIDALTSTLTIAFANTALSNKLISAIGEWAMAGLTELFNIKITSNINTILANAFANNPNLKEAFIPKNTIFIQSNAFASCPNLTIKCAANKKPITWADDWNPDNRPVIWGCADSTVCDTYFAFTLSDDGTYYKVKAVSGVKWPSRLEIPGAYNGKPVKVIEANGFSNCSSTWINILPGITTIEDRAFENCALILDVNFPDTLEYIGVDAFHGCTALDLIQLPENLKTLKWGAFRDCGKAETIYIPKSVKTIENGAFLGAFVENRTIYCEATSKPSGWDSQWHAKTVVDNDLFNLAGEYTIVYNAAAVTDASKFAFSELSDGTYRIRPKDSLVIMHVPKYYNNKLVTELSGWWGESSAKQASLVKVILPDSIKTINGQAFKGCKNLNEINIPSSVTTIKNYAFGGNRAGYYDELSGSSIAKIKIPDSVTNGAEGLFKACQNLRYVELPDHWETIDSDMFNSCENLTDIMLPLNCNYIGSDAFLNCKNLQTVHIAKKHWNVNGQYLDLSTKTPEETATLLKENCRVAWKAITPAAPKLTCEVDTYFVAFTITNPNNVPQAVTVNAVYLDNSEGYNKLVAKQSEFYTIGANQTIYEAFDIPFDPDYNYALEYSHVTITACFESGPETMTTYLASGNEYDVSLATEDGNILTDENNNILIAASTNYINTQIIDPAITYEGYAENTTTHSFTIANYNDFDVNCTWSGGDSGEAGTLTIAANSTYRCTVVDSADEIEFGAQFMYKDLASNLVSGSYAPPSEFKFKLVCPSEGIARVSNYTEIIGIDETKTIDIMAGIDYVVGAQVTNAEYTLTKDELGLIYTLSIYNAQGNVKVILSARKPLEPILPEMTPLA